MLRLAVSSALALVALSPTLLAAKSQDPQFALPKPRADAPALTDEQEALLAQRLCEAIDRGDRAAVVAAIDEGANPNVGMGAGDDDTKGRTPLIHAVIAGSTEMVDVLVARGARLDNGDDHEHTPLMYAALVKNVDLVRNLVRLGARLDMVDDKDQTARDYDDEAPEIAAVLDLAAAKNQELLQALSAGDVDAAKLALAAGASPNANDGTTSMLMFAVRRGDVELATTCLVGGCRADLVHVAGWTVDTPIGIAAEASSPELMRLLLEKGAPGRAALDEALAAAAGCEHADRKDRVALLLKAGADPSLDSLLKTPALPAAASRGDLETMALLIAGGARQSAVDHALVRAAGLDDPTRAKEVVQALLACGAEPSFAYLFTTALGAAVEKGHLEVAALLFDRVDDETLNTAVTEAARGTDAASLKWLCERAGTRIDFAFQAGMFDPPLICAIEGECQDCVAVLLAAGAPVDLPPSFTHDTPLIAAVRKQKREAIALLLAAGADPQRRWRAPLRPAESAMSVATELGDEEILALLRTGKTAAPAADRDPLGRQLAAAKLNFREDAEFYDLSFTNGEGGRSQRVYLRRHVETFASLSVQEIFSVCYDRPTAPDAAVLTKVFQKRFALGGFVLEEPREGQPNWRIRFRVAASTTLSPELLRTYMDQVQGTADAMEKELDSEDRL